MHPAIDMPNTRADLHWGAIKMLAAGVAASVFLFALSTEDGPILCPFRRCTGGYCPGCGLTRSGGRLLRGDLAGSWQQHPFLIVAVIQASVAAIVWRFSTPAIGRWLRSRASTVVGINVSAILALWIVRMVDGSIPVPFGG